MSEDRKIPLWLVVITTVAAILLCGLIVVNVNSEVLAAVLSQVGIEEESTLLTLADHQSQNTAPTPFQPQAAVVLPTATAHPTSTPTPTSFPVTPTPTREREEIQSIPISHYISGIYGYPQMTTLDCEARSAVDWARYFGFDINEVEFIEKIPLSDDPEEGFVGNIHGPMGQLPPDGYGVYPPPVADVLQEYGVNAIAVTDMTFAELQNEIANDRPVIVWIVNLPFEIDATTYTPSNGNTLPVARFEHTWIVTGYNAYTVTVVDSEWTYNVKLATFKERWDILGNRAIIIDH